MFQIDIYNSADNYRSLIGQQVITANSQMDEVSGCKAAGKVNRNPHKHHHTLQIPMCLHPPDPCTADRPLTCKTDNNKKAVK